MLSQKLQELRQSFLLSTEEMLAIANSFRGEISRGLTGDGSLKMLRTFLKPPVGAERGQYLAIDFGGTNIRVQRVELLGEGNYQILDSRIFRLRDTSTGYDFTAAEASAAELFDFIAQNLEDLVAPQQSYNLGHTFSFPCRQLTVNRAILLQWTKEIQTCGVEGVEITALLERALAERNLTHIKPVAVLNDTTAILITAAYSFPQADIGSICGTGHNTCYLEPREPSTLGPMIINMESGNFNLFPRTAYDVSLDTDSEKPGQQHLEKAASGHYVGEVARVMLLDLVENGLLFSGQVPEGMTIPYGLRAQDLAHWLGDTSADFGGIEQWLEEHWQVMQSSLEERSALQTLASLVTTRSARLVAATYTGILLHVDPELECKHVIGVDGSLIEKMPFYADHVLQVFDEIFGDKAKGITLRIIKDGSGVGAAIAAATVGD